MCSFVNIDIYRTIIDTWISWRQRELLFRHLMFSSGGSTATMMTTIICTIIVVFQNTLCGHGSTELYRARFLDRNRTLVMTCSTQQVTLRSKIGCLVALKVVAGTGAYYSPSTGICSMCLPQSTMTSFVACTKDMYYYSVGRKNSRDQHVEIEFV